MSTSAKAVVGKGLEKGRKMITEPVRLEDVPSIMSLEEVPQKIWVPNPGKRKLVIKPEESGYDKEQVFTSECLPDEIPYEFLGLTKFPDGRVYPKYRANVVTKTELRLEKGTGYENGVSTIDKIVWWLTVQEKMLEAKSIKKSDLKYFDYESEGLSYWLASPTIYIRHGYISGYEEALGLATVIRGNFSYNNALFNNYSSMVWYNDMQAVRPVMLLASKVQIDPSPKITWVEL